MPARNYTHSEINHPEIWDQFWDNAPKIGRSQFRRDRDSYDLKEVAMHPYSRYWTKERKSYWDEVDPNDMQMVLHKSTPVYRSNETGMPSSQMGNRSFSSLPDRETLHPDNGSLSLTMVIQETKPYWDLCQMDHEVTRV